MTMTNALDPGDPTQTQLNVPVCKVSDNDFCIDFRFSFSCSEISNFFVCDPILGFKIDESN